MHQIYLLTLGKRNIILTSVSKEGKENAHYFLRKKEEEEKKRENSCNCAWSESGVDPARRSRMFFLKKKTKPSCLFKKEKTQKKKIIILGGKKKKKKHKGFVDKASFGAWCILGTDRAKRF